MTVNTNHMAAKLQVALVALVLLLPVIGRAQQYQYVYRKADHSHQCYLKVLPQTGPVRGLVIRDYSALPDTSKPSPFRLTRLCADSGLITLYTVSSAFNPELFYADTALYVLDQMVAEVIQEHQVPKNNIFIGGMSASGTRALRYAQFCEQGRSLTGIRIKGVFAVDSPLDLERFYRSVFDHRAYFKKGMLDEAMLMSEVFPRKMGGSPDEFPQKYRNASVFSHTDSLGGNAVLLKNTHLIFFHEPDIDWWTQARGASYFDINSYDMAAMVARLRWLGSNRVQLITTTGRGFDREGNRNCHSWTIVDETYLRDWIVQKLE